MIDLFCLVADKSMEASISGLLNRPESLGIRPITREIVVHDRRDPGCFHYAADFLDGFRSRARQAVVILDREWDGVPANTATETAMEWALEQVRVPWSSSIFGDLARKVSVSVEEPASLRFGNGLAFDESQLVGSMLDGVTIHVGGLVREVEDEPQFEAGVRDGGPDARVAGFGYGALEVGMGIDVEHAPDLVELGVPARL